jgi:Fe-S cluster assembly scaffold protein SufB
VNEQQLIEELLASIDIHKHYPENTAHIEIHGNQVIGVCLVDGLTVKSKELKEGVKITLRVAKGVKIKNPVHLCFGMIPETGIQRIEMQTVVENDARVGFIAHCTFPNARKIDHIMNADITVGENACYSYFERHVHGEFGGIRVIPKAKVTLLNHARFVTEFELLKGRVGEIDIDYETVCDAYSVMEMKSRISGRKDDRIKIREAAVLKGEYSRGLLASNIALKDNASAEIYNDLRAEAAYAHGHVDCNEIVLDNAVARAIPIVQVNNPKAHVTHEAAIGSVDSKQLQTLMSRGLCEDEAVDLILQGMLSQKN